MTDQNVVAMKSGANATTATQPSGASNGSNAPSANQQTPSSKRDARTTRDESTLLPPVDVVEDATGITVFADLPGVTKDRLDVRVEADTLLIEGELGLATPDGMTSSHAEVQVTRYRRTFTLSKELNADKVDAEFNHGVLRVRIPKADDAQPRRIAVKVH